MSAYPNAKFLLSANRAQQFPADLGAEVAVAGRSNAGKSSAINAITQRHSLARTSKTPGATRLVNFFELAERQRLVDLPGYGYAAVPGEMRRHWGKLIEAYFHGRQALRGAIVVMDIRHPLTDLDQEMLAMAEATGKPIHLLLTKADKLGRGAAKQALLAVRKAVGSRASVQVFSAVSGEGVAEARAVLKGMLEDRQKETPAGPAEPAGGVKPGVGG
jgi:GTP-binding protein